MLSPVDPESSSPSSSSASTSSPEPSAKRKKRSITTRVACNGCRARKQACDGARPTCSRCLNRGIDACVYDTEVADESRNDAIRKENQRLKARLKEYEDAWKGLGRSPLPVSAHAARPPHLTVSVPEHQEHRVLLPPTRSKVEHQLMLSHPTLFPYLTQVHGGDVDLPWQPLIPISKLVHLEGAPSSLANILFEASGNSHAQLVPQVLSPAEEVPEGVPETMSRSLPPPSSAVASQLSPRSSPCDPRLRHLEVSYWTDVPIANSTAIDILALYLASEQPIAGFFDADLFVGDLVAKRPRFCSPFLVSSLLYWASHACKAIHPNPPIVALGKEAKERWASEEHQRRPYDTVTLVATLILSISASGDGLRDVANHTMTHALHMASALGWFGRPIETPHHLDPHAADTLRMDSHAAWGIFNYTTMTSFHTQRLMMTSPPVFPMPGDGGVIGFDRDTGAALHHPLPPYMGKTFTAACQFFLIANEITLSHLSENEHVSRINLSLDFAESIYQRLVDWSNHALPSFTEQTSGDDGAGDHQDILHIWIHCRILDLLRPFASKPVRLQTSTYREWTTKDIYNCSLDQLKRHVLIFPFRHASAAYSGLFNLAIMQMTSSVIADPSEPSVRFWFSVCMRNLLSLTRAYPLIAQMLDVFVRMAVEKRIISSGEAGAIMRRGLQPMTRAATGGDFVLDLDLALESRGMARMDQLALSMESNHIDSEVDYDGLDELGQ